jgi:hypothetical protein
LHPNSKGLIALLQVVLKVMPSPAQTWMKPRPPFLSVNAAVRLCGL